MHFHAGLSDCKVIIGEAAELECKVSSEDCKGMWYKDGAEVSPEPKTNNNNMLVDVIQKSDCFVLLITCFV